MSFYGVSRMKKKLFRYERIAGNKPFRLGNLQLVVTRQQISLKLLNKTPWEIVKSTAIFSSFICQLVNLLYTILDKGDLLLWEGY